MIYNILTFKEFRTPQSELNHLKHKLKIPLSTDERDVLDKEIESKTQIVKHHLNKLHQGVLGEQ